MVGPKVRKANWIWKSITAAEADAIRAQYEVGLDLAGKLRTQLEPEADPKAEGIVLEAGKHLTGCVANKLHKFKFEIIKDARPNAFALPGGFIFITSSILELCRWNQDEIAFVLAHEMAHVVRGHAAERVIANSVIALGVKALNIRTPAAGAVSRAGVKLLQSAYSQDSETEADSLAVRLVVAARYDPYAAIKLLGRLDGLGSQDKKFGLGSYFSSHPAFELRIQKINRLLSEQSI
jgi:Zn-dependent protease with chaperone function